MFFKSSGKYESNVKYCYPCGSEAKGNIIAKGYERRDELQTVKKVKMIL